MTEQQWSEYEQRRRDDYKSIPLPLEHPTPAGILVAVAVIVAFVVMFFGWWVAADAEEPLPVGSIVKANVRVDSALNIRAEPSTDSRIISKLASGAKVKIVEVSNGWALVECVTVKREPLGWVFAKYLSR